MPGRGHYYIFSLLLDGASHKTVGGNPLPYAQGGKWGLQAPSCYLGGLLLIVSPPPGLTSPSVVFAHFINISTLTFKKSVRKNVK